MIGRVPHDLSCTVFEQTGGFDQRLQWVYWDVEINCMRVRALGHCVPCMRSAELTWGEVKIDAGGDIVGRDARTSWGAMGRASTRSRNRISTSTCSGPRR